MSKACFKCKRMKPLSEFYKHAQMKDGHLNKCKECAKLDVRRHRRDNDHVREYDRRRYAEDPAVKARVNKTVKSWRQRYPDRYRAHTKVSNAIRSGKLKRQPCEVCGELKVHAHHDDYSKPLEVRWLCALHHQRHHAE